MTVTLRSQLRLGWRPLALLGVICAVLCAVALLAGPAGAHGPAGVHGPTAARAGGPVAARLPATGAHLLPGARRLAGVRLLRRRSSTNLYPDENPADYETGYVNDFADVLKLFDPGLQIVNDGCPGETTESFIKGPCDYQLEFPLHHPYTGGPDSSQLSDALAYLEAHPGSVNPITIDIGANDALGLIETTCKLEAACIAAGAPAVFAKIGANLGLILGELRAAAPHAQIIVLGLYNPFGETITGGERTHRGSQRSRGQSRGRGWGALRRSAAILQPAGRARSADDLPAHQHVHAAGGHPPDRPRLQGARGAGAGAVSCGVCAPTELSSRRRALGL